MNKPNVGLAALFVLAPSLALVACAGDDTNFGVSSPAATDASVDATKPSTDAGAVDAATADSGTGEGGASSCGDAGTNQTPATLECTGLYSDFASKTIASDVQAYSPAIPLWSDGATKNRWVSLPPGTTIDATDPNEWTFPIGTRFWKEFSVGGKRVETRFFQKVLSNYWIYATYLWNDDDSAATAFGGGDLPNVITTDAGTTYHVPTSTECIECHKGRTDRIMGFEQVSLGTAGATGLTLSELVSQGLLSPAPANTNLTIADDGTGKAAPALGWLHINCGVPCHNRNVGAEGYITGEFFRIDPSWLDGRSATTYDSETTTINVPAVTPAWAGQIRIDPGHPEDSLDVSLISTRTADYTNQMPPLVTKVVPTAYVAEVTDWIAAMTPNAVDAGEDAASEDAGNADASSADASSDDASSDDAGTGPDATVDTDAGAAKDASTTADAADAAPE